MVEESDAENLTFSWTGLLISNSPPTTGYRRAGATIRPAVKQRNASKRLLGSGLLLKPLLVSGGQVSFFVTETARTSTFLAHTSNACQVPKTGKLEGSQRLPNP